MEQQRPIGFWVKLVDELIDEQFEGALEEHGVTRRQWQILNLLSEKPATLTELNGALAAFLDQSSGETVSEQLEELTESSWLTAEGGTYTLTELGQSSLNMLGGVVRQNRQHLSEGISQEEYEQALDVLERMARNLGWNE